MVAVASTLAAFGFCLWIGRSVSFGWMPRAEADRWVVDAAFATVMAGAVGAAIGWWAEREKPRSQRRESRRVSQRGKASRYGELNQVAGNEGRRTVGNAGTNRASRVKQRGRASRGGKLRQVGGDQESPRQP